MIYSSEHHRLQFLEQRDGKSGALDFAKRAMDMYRTAVLCSRKRGHAKPHHASFPEYRRKFIQSYCDFKRYLNEHAKKGKSF